MMKEKVYALLAAALMVGMTAEAAHTLDTVYVDADKENEGTYAGGYLSETPSVGMLKNQNIMETPLSTMSLTSKVIDDFAMPGSHEVMDLLSFNPAVRQTTSADIVAMRGKQVSAKQMTVNGVPGMYSNFNQGANYIAGIDMIGGPALLYTGSSTQNVIGGNINIRTKRAEENSTDVKTQFSGQSHFTESVDFSHRFGEDGSWGIRVNALTADGELAVHDEKLRQRNIFINADHKSADSTTNIFMGYAYSKHNGGNRMFQTVSSAEKQPYEKMPFLPEAPEGSHNTMPGWAYRESRTWTFTVNHEQKINDHWTAFLNAGIMRNDTPVSMDGKYDNSIFIFEPDGSYNGAFKRMVYLSASAQTSRYIGGGVKASYDWGFMKNDLILAIDRSSVNSYSASNNKEIGVFEGNLYQNNGGEAPVWKALTPRWSGLSVTKGLTLIDTMKFLDDKLVVNAGVHHHSNESISSSGKKKFEDSAPTYGVLYRITPKFSVYGSHTETFLDGTIVGAGYDNAGAILDPYMVKSNEVGVKWKNGQYLHTLAYYETKQPEKITTNNYVSYGGETKFKGFEWTTSGSISDKWDFIAGLGYNRYIRVRNNTARYNGTDGNGIPKWAGNVAVRYKANEQISVLGRMNFISHAKIAFGAYTVPSYLRFDLGLNYDTNWHGTPVTLSAMCYNVLNRKGWYTADEGNQLVVADPRIFMISANFKL